MCYNKAFIHGVLQQILSALIQIQEWNKEIASTNAYTDTQEGMKTLAATSMLLESIGEGLKKIDHKTHGELLCLQPEIPWADIMGMRNHIAHGYFDIDADIIFDVVKHHLPTLDKAIQFLIEQTA